MITYVSLFLISFLAATIFPTSSELVLIGLLKANTHNYYLLLGSASLGNILGSVFNWFLGFYLLKHINKNWFPFKKNQIKATSKWFNKFGLWSLFFSWVPIIGDPLTFLAGILKIRFVIFLTLVAAGKIGRYIFIYCLFN
tara:strand:- start:129 stop:548 length:420 start_codon:yes stop_codon:yes gene_type:complete